MGEEILEGTGALRPRTREFERGKALGLMAAGLTEMAGGVAGEIMGGMLSATGVGAALGVPAMAVSTAVVVGGEANVVAGVVGLMNSGRGLVRSHLRVRQSHRPRETVRRDHGHQSER